ncbi:hypothetical protein T492DRAFT_1025303, partial [Pavlovales sp. CCMP2436]
MRVRAAGGARASTLSRAALLGPGPLDARHRCDGNRGGGRFRRKRIRSRSRLFTERGSGPARPWATLVASPVSALAPRAPPPVGHFGGVNGERARAPHPPARRARAPHGRQGPRRVSGRQGPRMARFGSRTLGDGVRLALPPYFAGGGPSRWATSMTLARRDYTRSPRLCPQTEDRRGYSG